MLELSVARTVSRTKMLDFTGFLFVCPLEVAAENLRKAGLISDLLSILQNFIHNEQICHSSCAVLWSLAVSGKWKICTLRCEMPTLWTVFSLKLCYFWKIPAVVSKYNLSGRGNWFLEKFSFLQ